MYVVQKDNLWYPAIPDYVAQAFHAARKANPTLKLFYNDYGGEGSGTPKSDKIYTMLQDLLAQGVPIDGVGLQMHLNVDWHPAATDIAANIQRLVALGLEVHITEMDVSCNPVLGIICDATRLQQQALVYGDVVQACVDNRKATHVSGRGGCKSFETWGFTDLHTWLWNYLNPTHANMQPLLYDMNYQPKAAYWQVLAVLQRAHRQDLDTASRP
jgi:endo-1,4-beta-xylanase